MAAALHVRPRFKWQRLTPDGSHRAPSLLFEWLSSRVRIETKHEGALAEIELPPLSKATTLALDRMGLLIETSRNIYDRPEQRSTASKGIV